MAEKMEKLEGNIKEEIVYADVDGVQELYQVVTTGEYLIQDDGSIINNSEVECQEIVIDAEDVNVFQKMEIVETDGTFSHVYEFDPNLVGNASSYFHFNSGSENSPVKKEQQQVSNNNGNNDDGFDNNYSLQLKDKIHRPHSLREKQLELNHVKQYGSRQRSSKPEQEEWYPNNERISFNGDEQIGDDDYSGDYEYGRKSKGFNRSLTSGRLSKPKKRVFAHRLQWKDKDMKEAMRSVDENKMTIRGAAKKFSVPYSTLKDRVRGRVRHGTKPGVKTVLSPEEEEELVRFINYMEECGFSLQCIDIREKASEILSTNQRHVSPYKQFMPGHNWLSGFTKRHPDVVINRASNRVVPPSSSKLKMMLKRFFEVSLQTYRRLGGEERSSRIYSMSLVQLASIPKTSIVLAASSDGGILPPFVVGNFTKTVLQHMQHCFPLATFALSCDFTSKDKLFFTWFRDTFLPTIKISGYQRPHILFLNQTIRNISIRLVEMSMTNDVHLVCMPTNLTQALQPLNSSLVALLDKAFHKCTKYAVMNGNETGCGDGENGSNLSDVQIAQALKKVFEKSELFREEIKKSFNDCGLFPLNSRAISMEKISMVSVNNSDDDLVGHLTEDITEDTMVNVSSFGHSIDNMSFNHGRHDEMNDQGGLQLLSELSTAVRTPPEGSPFVSSLSHVSRHPSAVKYRNNTSNSASTLNLNRSNERRNVRVKRSAAGASEKLMKKILVDEDGVHKGDEDDTGRPAKIPRRYYENEDDNESRSTNESFVAEEERPTGCSRTRPVENKYLSRRKYNTDDILNVSFSDFDETKDFASRGKRNETQNTDPNERRLNRMRNFNVEDERSSNSFYDAESDAISKAVASILPKDLKRSSTNGQVNSEFINSGGFNGKVKENSCPLLANLKLSHLPQLTKTPKLQYMLRKPIQKQPSPPQQLQQLQSQLQQQQQQQQQTEQYIVQQVSEEEIIGVDMVIQEEIITNDLDQYFIHNPQQMVVSDEVTVEEIVMDGEDMVTAVYDVKPDAGRVDEIFETRRAAECREGHQPGASTVAGIVAHSPVDVEGDTGESIKIEKNISPVDHRAWDTKEMSSDLFIRNGTKLVPLQPAEPVESTNNGMNVETLSLAPDSHPDVDILIGENIYKGSRKVRETRCLQLSGMAVHLIRETTLKEAIETSESKDPSLLNYDLKFLDGDS